MLLVLVLLSTHLVWLSFLLYAIFSSSFVLRIDFFYSVHETVYMFTVYWCKICTVIGHSAVQQLYSYRWLALNTPLQISKVTGLSELKPKVFSPEWARSVLHEPYPERDYQKTDQDCIRHLHPGFVIITIFTRDSQSWHKTIWMEGPFLKRKIIWFVSVDLGWLRIVWIDPGWYWC